MKASLGTSHKPDFINFGLNYKLAFEEIEDGECTEIHAPHILDYVPAKDYKTFIGTLVQKMRHGCELTLGGSDIFESSKQLLRGDYDLLAYNQIIYGDNLFIKLGQYSLHLVSDDLKSQGLQILEKHLDHNQMYVKAKRI